ncbi:hypothetical protein ABPG74_001960, partial [Tetrahymena malaccensis]
MSKMLKHFLLTQVQTLIVSIVITYLMQYSNYLAIYLVYCCPAYFFFVLVQYFYFWRYRYDQLKIRLNQHNRILAVVFAGIFYGIYFGVFNATASLEFQQAQNCQIEGQFNLLFNGNEKYSILYLNFEFENQNYLGMACASNQNEGNISSFVSPFKFYSYKNVSSVIICSTSTNRFLITSQHQDYCTDNYTTSQIKLASWLCINRKFDLDELMKPQPCYVNFFGDKAKQNGLERNNLLGVMEFPLISYSLHAYFPKLDLIFLIIFCYYNALLTLNSIFQYSTDFMLIKCINKQQQNQQQQQQQNKDQEQNLANINQDDCQDQNLKASSLPEAQKNEDISQYQQNSNLIYMKELKTKWMYHGYYLSSPLLKYFSQQQLLSSGFESDVQIGTTQNYNYAYTSNDQIQITNNLGQSFSSLFFGVTIVSQGDLSSYPITITVNSFFYQLDSQNCSQINNSGFLTCFFSTATGMTSPANSANILIVMNNQSAKITNLFVEVQLRCILYCQSCSSYNVCTLCNNSISTPSVYNGQNYCQLTCPAGTYGKIIDVSTFQQTCSNCIQYCILCSDNTSCNKCQDGSYYDSSQQKFIQTIQSAYDPIYSYMNLSFYFQTYLQICDQFGATILFEPIDVQVTSNALPSLNRSYNKVINQEIEVDVKKYEIAFNNVFDLQVSAILESNTTITQRFLLNSMINTNSTFVYKFPSVKSSQNNLTCLQKQQNSWSSSKCQKINYTDIGGYYCYCKDSNPTTVIDDLSQLIENKNLQTAFSSQGLKNISNFGDFYKYAVFWTLVLITFMQIGLFLYGQRLDKKFVVYPEESIQNTHPHIERNNNNMNAINDSNKLEINSQNQNNQNNEQKILQYQGKKQIINERFQQQNQDSSQKMYKNLNFQQQTNESPYLTVGIIQKEQFSSEAQNKKTNFLSNTEDINLIDLDQQVEQKDVLFLKQQSQTSKINLQKGIQQIESLNSEQSQQNLQEENNQKQVISQIKLTTPTQTTNLLLTQSHLSIQAQQIITQQNILQLDQKQISSNDCHQLQNNQQQSQKIMEQQEINNKQQSYCQAQIQNKPEQINQEFSVNENQMNTMNKEQTSDQKQDENTQNNQLKNLLYYQIDQKVALSIASSVILVIGVTFVTTIHKIKFIGKKVSTIVMVCLLLFYYYVILSIITGEEASDANPKTLSFLLIVGIDFLGTMTFMAITKLSLVQFSQKGE